MTLIRSLKEDAIAPAMALVWRVFEEFEAPDYEPEGITEF